MPAPNPTGWTLNSAPRKPFGWNPATAVTFFEAYNRISLFIDESFPFSREMILLFFFHESAFSNVAQVGNGIASGFGQMQTRDLDKVAFFATLGDTIIPPTTKAGAPKVDPTQLAQHFATEDAAIDTHCKWLVWLKEQRGKGLDGMMSAQTGSFPNNRLIPVFKRVEPDLKLALNSSNRVDVINALNSVRWDVPIDPATKLPSQDAKAPLEPRPIHLSSYPDYWEYTLPQSDMILGRWD